MSPSEQILRSFQKRGRSKPQLRGHTPAKIYQKTALDEPKAGCKQHIFKKFCPRRPALLEHPHKYKPRDFSVWHAADLSNEAKNFRLNCNTNLDIVLSFICLRDSADPAG